MNPGSSLEASRPISRLERRLVPSFEALIFILLFWVSLFFMPQLLNGDGDLGRHLTVGETILSTDQVPRVDLFSNTRLGDPFVPHEWMSEVLFAAAYRLAGLNGVAWLTAFFLALTYALLAGGMRMLGVNAPLAAAGAIAAYAAGAIHHLARPHIFTLLCFTIFLIVLEFVRSSGKFRTLVTLPLVMLAWVNLHGAFIAGLVLISGYCVGALLDRSYRQFAQWTIAGLATLAVTLINPAGLEMLTNGFAFLGNRFLVEQTVEYASPDFHLYSTWPFAALLLGVLVLGARGRMQLAWTQIVPLAMWCAFALYSARNIPLSAQVLVIMSVPSLNVWLRVARPALGTALARFDSLAPVGSGAIWAILAVGAMVWLEGGGTALDVLHSGNQFSEVRFPVAAVDSLENELPRGNMFNEFTWGGYLLKRLWPRERVFIDGQTDFYGEGLTREYLDVVNAGSDWRDVLNKYDVQWIIIPPGFPLARELGHAADWVERYRDATAVVWVRR